jgi:hypothetical protein
MYTTRTALHNKNKNVKEENEAIERGGNRSNLRGYFESHTRVPILTALHNSSAYASRKSGLRTASLTIPRSRRFDGEHASHGFICLKRARVGLRSDPWFAPTLQITALGGWEGRNLDPRIGAANDGGAQQWGDPFQAS